MSRNSALFLRNAEEASVHAARQVVPMNYNNFSCRLIAPRLPSVVRSAEPRKVESKKERKPSVRRRLASAATAAALVIGVSLSFTPVATAGPLNLEPSGLRWVPATETVAFTGNSTGHLSLDLPVELPVDENDLASQLEAFSAQVSALTSKPFPSVRPAAAMQLSALTGVLLCAGLGVAIVRAGLLFRADLAC